MAVKRERFWPGVLALILALALSAQPLPDWAQVWRPDWIALVMIYLAIHSPRQFILGSALLVGLLLDALYGTPLGQYALSLIICCYPALKLHLRLMLVPIWQTTLSAVLFTALYQFMLFWCNGATGNDPGAASYLAPLLSNAIVWPLVLAALDRLRLGPRTKS
ncbi:MAG: rod shape-determining protein MreD [Pseudomonadota bacterium]